MVDEVLRSGGLNEEQLEDGVEEAFYLSNRCMSVSFHQYGD